MKDLLGTLLSGLCIIHCVFSGIILMLGSAGIISSSFHGSEVHLLIFIPILLLATLSFPHAKKLHGNRQPMIMGTTGVVLLSIALLMELVWHLHLLEVILTVIGGGLLMYAHLYNKKLIDNLNSV